MSHVTILTGASRGIGAAIAKYILTANSSTKLVAVARSAGKLEDLVSEYGADRVVAVTGDVTDPETVTKAVSAAIDNFGQLDAVIANAGVLDPVSPVVDAKTDLWANLYAVNLFAVVELIKQSIPELRKTGGKILTVSSAASVMTFDGWAAYGSSKAALNHLVMSVAEEEKGKVSAISIAPGIVDTGMQVDIREKFGANMKPEAIKQFNDLHSEGQLLPASVPAAVYGRLALNGWSDEVNGKYFDYDDEKLA